MSDTNQKAAEDADIATFFEKEKQKKKTLKQPKKEALAKGTGDPKKKEEAKILETSKGADYESSDEEGL
jgi:hypothetical protein